MSAAYLAVADDGAAEALAEVQVGEVVESSAVGGVAFGSCGPVDVVVDDDRARRRARPARPTGDSSPTRNGASGRWTSRPVRPVHRVGGADHREPGLSRAVAPALSGPPPSAPRRPGPAVLGAATSAVAVRDHVAVGVDDLGHDPLRGDADDQGAADVRRRARSTSRPARARWCVRRCRASSPASLSRRTLSEIVGLEIPVRAASSARVRRRCVHQGTQHVLVGQRPQQVQRRLRRRPRQPVLVRTLA